MDSIRLLRQRILGDTTFPDGLGLHVFFVVPVILYESWQAQLLDVLLRLFVDMFLQFVALLFLVDAALVPMQLLFWVLYKPLDILLVGHTSRDKR